MLIRATQRKLNLKRTHLKRKPNASAQTRAHSSTFSLLEEFIFSTIKFWLFSNAHSKCWNSTKRHYACTPATALKRLKEFRVQVFTLQEQPNPYPEPWQLPQDTTWLFPRQIAQYCKNLHSCFIMSPEGVRAKYRLYPSALRLHFCLVHHSPLQHTHSR